MIKKPMKIVGKILGCLVLFLLIFSFVSVNVEQIQDEIDNTSTSDTLARMDRLIAQGNYQEMKEQLNWNPHCYAEEFDATWELLSAYDLVCEYEMYTYAYEHAEPDSEREPKYYYDKAQLSKKELLEICENSQNEQYKKSLEYFKRRVEK